MLMDAVYFESSLPPLPPASTLRSEETHSASETGIIFRCDAGIYRLRVVYDSDLLSIRYRIDGDNCLHEVLVIVRNGDAHFEPLDGCPLTALDLSRLMIGALTRRCIRN
jgi:hypothetical protein